MSDHYLVLGSGSSGNASVLDLQGSRLLIDLGLGCRTVGTRLGHVGLGWKDIDAAILTHTHGDHWKENCLEKLLTHEIPLHCASGHQARLRKRTGVFRKLEAAGLVKTYRSLREFVLFGFLKTLPIPVSHDAAPTFGFRFDRERDLFAREWRMGYASDLGVFDERLVELCANADLLAVEFNHDEELQQASGRPQRLIDRVLGDLGHLSNNQAAEFVEKTMRVSRPGRLGHVVQLHLSRQCNRPELASGRAMEMLADGSSSARVHTAEQYRLLPITLGE